MLRENTRLNELHNSKKFDNFEFLILFLVFHFYFLI